LDHGELADSGCDGGIPKNRHSRDGWGNLLEQLRPFRGQCIVKCNKASCVATWSRQAVDVAAANWIDDTVEYDRHGACRLQQRLQRELAGCHDNVRRKRDQFFRVFASLHWIAASPSDFNPHIAAIDPTQLMQDFLEHSETGLLVRLACRTHEHADPPHLLALLRTRRQGPSGCGSAEKLDDLPSSHAPSQQQTMPGLREVLLNFRQ
jgi:hypothetical protein